MSAAQGGRARGGFSLVEIVVALGLVTLVGFIGLNLIIPTARSFSRTSTRADLQQQALVVGNRMAADLARASVLTLRIHPSGGASDPLVIGLVPLVDVNVDGGQVWSRTLICYVWDPKSQRVVRRTWSKGGSPDLGLSLEGTVPTAPSDADLVKMGTAPPSSSDQLLASHVKQADLRGSGSLPLPAIELPLRLHLVLEAWSSQGSMPEHIELDQQLSTRNTSQQPQSKPTTAIP